VAADRIACAWQMMAARIRDDIYIRLVLMDK
jgi:hypothetical protein